jgi:hypothetical protein
MREISCPAWIRQQGISDGEYGVWLRKQRDHIWSRERKKKKKAFATPAELLAALDKAANESTGRDPYTGMRLNAGSMKAGWKDPHAGIADRRHQLYLKRSVLTFDHVRGLGRRSYQLCTRETNSAKSWMSRKHFIELCHRVARRNPLPTAMSLETPEA